MFQKGEKVQSSSCSLGSPLTLALAGQCEIEVLSKNTIWEVKVQIMAKLQLVPTCVALFLGPTDFPAKPLGVLFWML